MAAVAVAGYGVASKPEKAIRTKGRKRHILLHILKASSIQLDVAAL